MKTRRHESGFILLYVVLLLALVGPATWILFDTALQSARRTRLLHVQSETEDLLFSGRAWAAANRLRLRSASEGATFTLDPNGLDLSNGTCRLTVLSQEAQTTRVGIEAHSAIGRREWTRRAVLMVRSEADNHDQPFPGPN